MARLARVVARLAVAGAVLGLVVIAWSAGARWLARGNALQQELRDLRLTDVRVVVQRDVVRTVPTRYEAREPRGEIHVLVEAQRVERPVMALLVFDADAATRVYVRSVRAIDPEETAAVGVADGGEGDVFLYGLIRDRSIDRLSVTVAFDAAASARTPASGPRGPVTPVTSITSPVPSPYRVQVDVRAPGFVHAIDLYGRRVRAAEFERAGVSPSVRP